MLCGGQQSRVASWQLHRARPIFFQCVPSRRPAIAQPSPPPLLVYVRTLLVPLGSNAFTTHSPLRGNLLTGAVLLVTVTAGAIALAPRLSRSLALVASPRLQATCSALLLHVRVLGLV